MTGQSKTTLASPRFRPRLSLRTRLLLAQGIVVTAGVFTAALVAAIAGPPIFHQHLIESGHPANSPELEHIETAYSSANTIALGTAMVIALTAAGLVTWYLTRRMTRPLADLAEVARSLSQGDYAARAPQLGAGPEIDGLAATFNDVATRLQTTEDTRRRLLADLAHEMRTPLSTIGAYLDGLDDGVTDWTPDTARVLRDQSSRLIRLSEDIGEVSRAEEGRLDLERVPVSVDDVIWAAAQGVRTGYAAKGVNLLTPDRQGGRADGRATGLVVSADRARVLQVLANLLTNALRHTPPGGTVTVGVVKASRGLVVLEVADTGEGIPAEQLPHIFERFYRGDTARDRDHGGSGIGLTIALSVALAQGGTLDAASDGPGRGSTFRLTLPHSTHTKD